jgi:hypothetical protein
MEMKEYRDEGAESKELDSAEVTWLEHHYHIAHHSHQPPMPLNIALPKVSSSDKTQIS